MKQLLFLILFSMLLSCEIEDPREAGLLVPRTVDEDTSLPSVSLNGTQLHAETFGYPADPMLVLLYGGPGGDYRSMLNAKVFADDEFFIVFYDQRETGSSKREDESQFTDTPVQLMIDDLDALIAHFRADNTQKVFLMGHSWGY